MTTRKVAFALVACFLAAVPLMPSLSQTARPDRTAGRGQFERMRDMRPPERFERFMREAKQREAEAMQQALGVDQQRGRLLSLN